MVQHRLVALSPLRFPLSSLPLPPPPRHYDLHDIPPIRPTFRLRRKHWRHTLVKGGGRPSSNADQFHQYHRLLPSHQATAPIHIPSSNLIPPTSMPISGGDLMARQHYVMPMSRHCFDGRHKGGSLRTRSSGSLPSAVCCTPRQLPRRRCLDNLYRGNRAMALLCRHSARTRSILSSGASPRCLRGALRSSVVSWLRLLPTSRRRSVTDGRHWVRPARSLSVPTWHRLLCSLVIVDHPLYALLSMATSRLLDPLRRLVRLSRLRLARSPANIPPPLHPCILLLVPRTCDDRQVRSLDRHHRITKALFVGGPR